MTYLVYFAFVGLLNLFLAVVWKSNTFVNAIIKVTLFVVFVWSAAFFFAYLSIKP